MESVLEEVKGKCHGLQRGEQQMVAHEVSPATTSDDLLATADLFTAYTTWLELDLAFQDFKNELAALPGKYASPSGVLLLARSHNGIPLGCVALRPMESPGICEMKRLYVAPAGRGWGLGKKLVEMVLAEAKRIGYQSMRLDTLPRMQSAVALYKKHGFVKIEPYYETPLEGTLFFQADLRN